MKKPSLKCTHVCSRRHLQDKKNSEKKSVKICKLFGTEVQSDRGPYCLQYSLPKFNADEKADDISCELIQQV